MITRGSRPMLHSWETWAYTFWPPLYSAIDFYTLYSSEQAPTSLLLWVCEK